MKVIIAGSRFLDGKRVYDVITETIRADFPSVDEIVSGHARGVDSVGERWAVDAGMAPKLFPAEWERFGNAAGPRRNRQMAEYADALLAIWDGKSRGTAHMIATMQALGKPVVVRLLGRAMEARTEPTSSTNQAEKSATTK